MKITTDRGLSDEGDPWFVFCREEGGDPVVHFARIDGQYIIASPAYSGVARGLDFKSMVQDLISRHKIAPVNKDKKSNIFMHPAALLVIVVGTAFFKTPGEARADETHKKDAAQKAGDASSASFLDRSGVPAAASDGSTPATSGEQMELAQNMSHLLMVAASAVVAADANQIAAGPPVADLSTFATNFDDGASNQHDLATHHLLADETSAATFETISNEMNATSTSTAPSSTSVSLGDIASSALKLMTDLNDIANTHDNILGDHAFNFARDGGLPSASASFGAEAGFLAQKAALAAAALSETVMAQIASGLHLSASASSASQGTSVTENAIVVNQLPADLNNVATLANVAPQAGNADNFLAGNNIIIDLHQNSLFASISIDAPTNDRADATGLTDLGSHLAGGLGTGGSTTTGSVTTVATVATGTSTETISSSVFLKTLEAFVQDTPELGYYVSNDNYVFYNAGTTTQQSTHNEVVSMTFTDGSSIEIIGQAQFLANIIAHAQL
ncbi:MAG: hypothetical protein WB816_00805 [Methylocystis sp.]